MATQKKGTKKTVVSKSVEAPVQETSLSAKDLLTRVVLVFETAVLYFIILFIIFVANNFTVMFFPKG
ncbi:MAG: hypothetical protein IKL32_02290 [Alphaproteobacteria bacterium]|nr:hypothetical protein [Alphaproteobacteria bacterium]